MLNPVPNPNIHILGMDVGPDGLSRPRESVSRSPYRRRTSMGQTVTVVNLRVLNRYGTRCRLPPMQSLRCSRMLNRLLGVLFDSDDREIPTEIDSLFQLSMFIFIYINPLERVGKLSKVFIMM